ncbi:MAG: phosphotransferase family protein, partial [Actinomycetota bacterium]|nr:phosphotransferase family protein [Actinomycetota bacterium]
MNSFSSDLDDGNGLLSWPALQEWILNADLPGKGEIKSCEQLSGGTQNNLFLLTRTDDTEMVLRRPPRHPRPHNDRTMMREAQVLAALSGSDVPHPAFYSACDDPSVIGVCFYLMAPIKGFNPFSENPEPYASNAEWYRELGLSIVDGIAALTRIDHVAVGLEDFGKPERWIERQVERWRSQLEGYSSFDA